MACNSFCAQVACKWPFPQHPPPLANHYSYSHIKPAMSAILHSASGVVVSVGNQLQHTSNRLLPPSRRAETLDKTRAFAIANPKTAVRQRPASNTASMLTHHRPSSPPSSPSPAFLSSSSLPLPPPSSSSPSQLHSSPP